MYVAYVPYGLIAALSVAASWLVLLALAYLCLDPVYLRLDPVVIAVSVGSFLVAVNFVTFIFVGYDKSIVRRPVYRVPESVLLWLAFLGGSLAAGLAVLFFRHKTRKRTFVLAYLAILFVQIAMILFAQIAIVFYGYGK